MCVVVVCMFASDVWCLLCCCSLLCCCMLCCATRNVEGSDCVCRYSWVVANSLVESNKQQTQTTNYNLRVVECRLAALILAYTYSLITGVRVCDVVFVVCVVRCVLAT